ncbi:MAG: hypothetical protein MRZ79_02970 [Bacteroidia bacterium]|nr:hypothetical protein [Bacteroidia bacterium]
MRNTIYLLAFVFAFSLMACERKAEPSTQDLPKETTQSTTEKPESEAPKLPPGESSRFLAVSQGSKGLRLAVVDLHLETYQFYPVKKDKVNFGEWDAEMIDEAFEKMRSKLKELYEGYEVPANNVRFFISSGFKAQISDAGLWGRYDNWLKKTGYGKYVTIVSPEEEARYGFITAVPPDLRDQTFFMDIGGSNTKMKTNKSESSMKFGSRTASGHSVEDIQKQVDRSLSAIPNARFKKVFAYYGGGPFITSCVMNPILKTAKKYDEPFFEFSMEQLLEAEQKVRNNWGELVNSPDFPDFYSQEQVLNCIFIMKAYAKKAPPSASLLFINQDMDWSVGATALALIGK